MIFDNRDFTKLSLYDEIPEDQQELYSWINDNTSKQSLWFIPSDMMYFRNHAGRAAAVAWMDGTFGYFDYNFNRKWRERYTKVFGAFKAGKTEPHIENVEGIVNDLDGNEVFLLKRESLDEGYQALYQNGSYYIYQLK